MSRAQTRWCRVAIWRDLEHRGAGLKEGSDNFRQLQPAHISQKLFALFNTNHSTVQMARTKVSRASFFILNIIIVAVVVDIAVPHAVQPASMNTLLTRLSFNSKPPAS